MSGQHRDGEKMKGWCAEQGARSAATDKVGEEVSAARRGDASARLFVQLIPVLFVKSRLFTEGADMKKRGKVLRDTSNGSGIISSDGKQFEFSLEKNWRSDSAPTVGMVVEFDLNEDGSIRSVVAVNKSQLVREQADVALKLVKEKGSALFREASTRLGTSVLIAWVVLAVSWFYLNAINISISASVSVGITFWELLGLVNNSANLAYAIDGSTGDKGIYGLLAVAALAGPALPQVWRHPVARLGSCLPFAFMLFILVMTYMSFRDTASEALKAASVLVGGVASAVVNNMIAEMVKAIHIGFGGFAAMVASVYLAFVGGKQYLAAKTQV